MLYNTGTIAINGNTATGTGTNWTAPASQVRAGQTIIVMSNPVQMFQISSVNSATSMTVTPAASPALSGQKYGILVSDNISVDGLAQAMSQLIKEYDENIGAWETFAATSANQSITVTINGTPVTIPGIGKLAQKGSNGALAIADGGTGATTVESARSNLGLGSSATKDIGTSGAVVPLLNAANTWSATQSFSTYPYIDMTSYPALILRVGNMAAGTVGKEVGLETQDGTVYVWRRKERGDQTDSTRTAFPQQTGTLALATSDERLKEVISNQVDGYFERLSALKVVEYHWNDISGASQLAKTRVRRGFIAQQVNAVNESYALPPETEDDFWGIDDRAIVADLLLAILEIKAQLEEVTKKLTTEE
ncbi:tail fiber domain-containing protein [Enterobacter kobei]|uniref:tail fiber domain-containing protein n=2 Tax=Enterobacter kobei TaxID=208224 RepID=UPI00099346BD|nr:tail fiber domain-containing protein [Enterobacter kobei]